MPQNPKLTIADHIAKLRAQEEANPKKQVADDAILFWGSAADKNYLPYLKGCVGSATTFLRLESINTISQVSLYCSTKKITRVVSSSPTLLRKLLHWDKRAAPSLSNYAGSYFKIPAFKPEDPPIEVVFINPLKHLVTVPYGRFMTQRHISKLTKPEKWFTPSSFSWSILKPENESTSFSWFSKCNLISIDIETFKENATIRCLSYTGFRYKESGEEWVSKSVVLPMDSEYALAIMRRWNWKLKAPKVFQNGKYDISYLSRYNAPVYNYLYDTAHLFHSWYSELPKDLGFLNSFFIREAVYWKDLASTNDLHEYYRYNALDTWGTGNCFLAMLLEAPKYAIDNYLLEFPLVFPCHLAEMTGIERDMDRLIEAKKVQDGIIDTATAFLNKILSVPEGETFNVNSPIQMKQLLKLLGCVDLKSADAKNLKKAKFRHPFNARLIDLVTKIRKARKLTSTYLTSGKEFSRLDGTGFRILYSLNPHGTDSSRLASREHHFWCGLQIQNIPRPDFESDIKYSVVKSTLKADPDFLLAEVDLEQAESRDTAYISGDSNLIKNVETSPDFHCANASAFFGIPFEELYDVKTGKKLNKKIRDIAKSVNHGANYNMGAYVLVDTMGEKNIVKAKALLKLDRFWGNTKVAEYLLKRFHVTYPDIKEVFYKGVVEEILTTRKLSSKAHFDRAQIGEVEGVESYNEGAGSWTRYCFGNPEKNKQHLNSYIAHPPQSLNAQLLNRAWLKVFRTIAMNPKHSADFKLCAQIHDSILFQYRKGHEYICDMVKDAMEIPCTIRAYDGEVRTFTVPAGIKNNEGKGANYWSETE